MVRASILLDGVTAPVSRGRSIHERRNRASSSKRSRPTGALCGGVLIKAWSTAGILGGMVLTERPDSCQRRSGASRSTESVEEFAHAGEKPVALGVGLLRGGLIELRQKLALALREVLRRLHDHLDVEVADVARPQHRHALGPQAELLARLRAFRNLHLGVRPVDGR